MKSNILLATIAILIISLVAVGTSYGIGQYAYSASNKTHEELHEACGRNPQMQKMMEQMHGKNWKKHHDQNKDHMKDDMENSSSGSSMMSSMAMH